MDRKDLAKICVSLTGVRTIREAEEEYCFARNNIQNREIKRWRTVAEVELVHELTLNLNPAYVLSVQVGIESKARDAAEV